MTIGGTVIRTMLGMSLFHPMVATKQVQVIACVEDAAEVDSAATLEEENKC